MRTLLLLIFIPLLVQAEETRKSFYDQYIPECRRDQDIDLPFREIEISDLNHDGKKEKAVACESSCGAHTCEYTIFLSKKDTFVPSGEVCCQTPKVTNEIKNEMPVITAFDHQGCGGERGILTFYKFSRGKYREFRHVQCECKDENVTRPKECG